MTFSLDHIGIAVENLEESLSTYEALGFSHSKREVVESEKVEVAFFALENQCNIELLEGTSPDSAISKFIAKKGPGVHHVCLKVKDIEQVVKELKSKGVQLVNEEPRPGAHNCQVVFIHPKSAGGVLIELSEPVTPEVEA